MIISYHGANGFHLIDTSVLPPLGPAPPVYQERPIKLAADAEHRLRMLLFRTPLPSARRSRCAATRAADGTPNTPPPTGNSSSAPAPTAFVWRWPISRWR